MANISPAIKVHTFANGATVASLSPHGFKFSDGTESGPQNKEIVEYFTLQKKFRIIRIIKEMKLTSSRLVVSPQQKDLLREISQIVDLVLVPFQFLQALHDSLEQGEVFPNVVAFNATKETARSAPDQKVVDIDNWSVINLL